MLFRQLFDPTSSTYTYLLACQESRQAVLIDPVFEQANRDMALLDELGLTLYATLDTHCHADHVTAAWLLKNLTGSRIGCAGIIGARHVDIPLNEGDRITFGKEELFVLATPGHTDGCLTYVTADKTKAFTGDALLIRGCGRCDFQQGNAATLFHSIKEKIFALPEECAIYPGHDYSGKLQSSVFGFMANLKLPHPKLIDHAVPANLKSGEPEDGLLPPKPDWAPVHYTFSGIPEIDVEWVLQHRDQVQVLDVRESNELESPVDRLPQTLVIPLGQLRGKTAEVSRDKPIVCLCRSGRRSAMAVSILQSAGFDQVANISGGMLRWRELSNT
ncbi:MAG: MBL fold metallo-hydrolase [Reinekea sp.]